MDDDDDGVRGEKIQQEIVGGPRPWLMVKSAFSSCKDLSDSSCDPQRVPESVAEFSAFEKRVWLRGGWLGRWVSVCVCV